ncbi:MAG: cobalt-precorrin-6A reductase [Marmoricola sp.]
MTVLVLGGTAEARELAVLLTEAGVAFTSSLAGRVARPRLPVGEVRIGGFGGAEGLAAYLGEAGIAAVVDATHPFANGISANAATVCARTGVPLLRLERAGWSSAPYASGWHWVADHDEAARVTATLGTRPLLTVGRQSLGAFTGPLREAVVTARVVDEPDLDLPPTWRVLLSRGPYEIEAEKELLAGCDVLVTKDSGGTWTWPKMQAAADLGVAVVIVQRAPAAAGVETVGDAGAAAAWVAAGARRLRA